MGKEFPDSQLHLVVGVVAEEEAAEAEAEEFRKQLL
jgi:hypothetical protein